MPLKKTQYGGVCPLDKFTVDIAGGAGCYTKDPVEECLHCNFGNLDVNGFDLEKICQCPSDIDWDNYDRLRKAYASVNGEHSRKGFWEFINTHYKL